MQKILKFIGMISALIISVLGLSACSNDGVAQPAYGVPSEFGERVEEKENLDSVNTTRGEEADADASSLE